MSRRIGVKADQARRWFGKPPPLDKLNIGIKKLHDRLIPYSGYDFDSRAEVRYEELLHELSHHVTLSRKQWQTPRDTEVDTAIRALSPATRDGNEIDALALSILISEFIGRPLSLRYVDMAVQRSNLKLMNTRQARQMVRGSIYELEMFELGFAVSAEICRVLIREGNS